MQEQPEQEVPTGVEGCSHGAIATAIFKQTNGFTRFYVRVYSHQAKVGAKTKKIKEQAKMIKNKRQI